MTHHPLRRVGAALLGPVLLALVAGGAVPAASATPAPTDVPASPTPGASAPGPTRLPTPTPTPTMWKDEFGCVATLTIASRWPGGFVATVRVTNLNGMFPVDRWTVQVDLPEGQVAHVWNAHVDGESPAAFTPAPWTPRVGHAGSAEFGFQGTGTPAGPSVTCRPS